MTAADLYDDWHAAKSEQDERPTATAPWHLMAEPHLGNVSGLRVLEIGCGRGAFSELLAQRGALVVAADFSPVGVNETADRLRPYANATARVADIQQIPYPPDSFDLVVSLETLEHVPDPDLGLRELVRVCKPGGRLIVTGPNYLNLVGLLRIYLRLRGRPYTECGQPINKPLVFPVRVWKLRRHGCRVLHTQGQQHLLPLRRMPRLERVRSARWFAYDTLTVATKKP